MALLQTSTSHSSVDTPSTPANCANYHYDVFISHRGADVKNTFASHLYSELCLHGLQPFLDREELQPGELLSPQIEGAIRTAYVHIVILSPGYAGSRWCLDELRLILNKSGDIIIPVFYNVKPSEVRWTKGRYAEAINNHGQKGRFNSQILENWRKALEAVSYRVGLELEAYNGDERKLLDSIMRCVLEKRRKIGFNVAIYPTGLEHKVEDFEKTLLLQQPQSGKVKVVGIVGMGGLGKTTLAKKLFNEKRPNFGKSCFLFEVRENASRRSLNSLQTKLIKDLTHRDVQIEHVDEGIEKLKTYLSTSNQPEDDEVDQVHALIVLDDVDHSDQLDAFLPIKDVLRSDSLILVTSRYKDVLTSSGITESSIYKLTALSEQHSQQLFCLHAFCQPHPPPVFKDLVDDFCRACDGLPLSLKVFGRILCQKNDKSYWEGLLHKLKLPKEIQQSLKLSYDILDDEEKEIYLDIACYFNGKDRDMAIMIWEGSGWSGRVGLRNLQEKCLVEVDEKNTIKMHDHLRDLGREIADQQKSSGVIPFRLWRLIENIHDLWQQYPVIIEVRGIRTAIKKELPWFRSWRPRNYIDKTPNRFRKLQLVEAEDGDLESILRGVESPNIIWLRWNNCPYSYLPSWIPMKNIRVLQVEGKKLKTLWRSESQAPRNLHDLKLQHLDLSGCWHLQGLPDSFGCLTNLQHLKLSRCGRLQGLPDSFGCLTNLQHLYLSGCGGLQGLPDSFGCLTNLQHLYLSGCGGLQGLPDSFGCLTNLQHLYLSGCGGLQGFPDSFSFLRSLQNLDLSGCWGLKELPNSIGCLTNLQDLKLSGCWGLQGLPDSFGCLKKLQNLDLSDCWDLQALPDSFGCLTNLQDLCLGKCWRLQVLPDSFGCLTNLQRLYLYDCLGLQRLPDSFRCLTNQLDIPQWRVLQGFPDSVGGLRNFHGLDVTRSGFKLKWQSCPRKFWTMGFYLKYNKVIEDGICKIGL